MKFKMYSCKEIHKVSCHEHELKGLDRINYKMHLFMCNKCKGYVESLKRIDGKISQILGKRTEVDPNKIKNLEDEVIEKIKQSNNDS